MSCSTGWFDLFSEGPIDAFEALQHTGRVYLRISPGGHGAMGGLKFPSARAPSGLKIRSFEQWMTDPDTNVKTESTLLYYLMGDVKDESAPGNVYKVATKWPVDHTPTSYYLPPTVRCRRPNRGQDRIAQLHLRPARPGQVTRWQLGHRRRERNSRPASTR